MSKFSLEVKEDAYATKTIFIDDEPWKDIHIKIFGTSAFEITSKEQFDLLEKKKVQAFVYKKLALKNYSSFELKKVLAEHLVSPSLIDSLIEDFKRVGYINDADWLAAFIRSAQAKKCGPQWILQKLMLKGVSREIAENVLEASDSPQDRIFRIKKLLETKYRSKDLSDFKQKQKVIASLLRKGFSYEDIKQSF